MSCKKDSKIEKILRFMLLMPLAILANCTCLFLAVFAGIVGFPLYLKRSLQEENSAKYLKDTYSFILTFAMFPFNVLFIKDDIGE